MPKQVIDREKLIDETYAIASHEGVSVLSVRKVATVCGIAVGSVYVYFLTKAELTTAVLRRFSTETFLEERCAVCKGEGFTSYLRRSHDTLSEAIAAMNADWFTQVRRLPGSERCILETARAPMMAHMEQGLRHVLDAGDAVVRARFVGALHSESLCRFTLRSIFALLMEGSDCEAFFVLPNTALYADVVLYADATLYADPALSIDVTLYIDAEIPL